MWEPQQLLRASKCRDQTPKDPADHRRWKKEEACINKQLEKNDSFYPQKPRHPAKGSKGSIFRHVGASKQICLNAELRRTAVKGKGARL